MCNYNFYDLISKVKAQLKYTYLENKRRPTAFTFLLHVLQSFLPTVATTLTTIMTFKFDFASITCIQRWKQELKNDLSSFMVMVFWKWRNTNMLYNVTTPLNLVKSYKRWKNNSFNTFFLTNRPQKTNLVFPEFSKEKSWINFQLFFSRLLLLSSRLNNKKGFWGSLLADQTNKVKFYFARKKTNIQYKYCVGLSSVPNCSF